MNATKILEIWAQILENILKQLTTDPKEPEITIKEVNRAIDTLKKNKIAYDIPNKLYKEGPEKIITELFELIPKIWNQGNMSQKRKTAFTKTEIG